MVSSSTSPARIFCSRISCTGSVPKSKSLALSSSVRTASCQNLILGAGASVATSIALVGSGAGASFCQSRPNASAKIAPTTVKIVRIVASVLCPFSLNKSIKKYAILTSMSNKGTRRSALTRSAPVTSRSASHAPVTAENIPTVAVTTENQRNSSH